MAKETTVNVRIDEQTKKAASEIFEASGYTLSSAIRIFLTHVIEEKVIPFEYRPTSSETLKVIKESRNGKNVTRYKNVDDLIADLDA